MLDAVLYSVFGTVILLVIFRMIYGPNDCLNEPEKKLIKGLPLKKGPWEIELKVEQRPGGPMSRCPCSSKHKD
uniref:Uncharacterized protein n=1 Tax=Rhodnius prolixus TaxID=13249 RepID=A0A4P6D937_RHOPR